MIADMSRQLPVGTVTFLFSDIEGSTRLAQELGTDRWREVPGISTALGRPCWRRCPWPTRRAP